MTKSPEEYFQEQDFSAQPTDATSFSTAEQAFMDKYMGVDSADVLRQIGIEGAPSVAAAEPDLHAQMSVEKPLDEILRQEPELQMVAFFIGEQEFVIPTMAVQEVIRAMPLAKLPSAPQFVAGVINLRGKVTPLIHLRDVMEVASPRKGEDKFIIICRRKGLQIGMIIERVHTMYRVPQEDIDWSVEAHIGMNVDFVAGLLKLNDQLVSIVSVDRVITDILR